ncbi:MAG: hypothetical protein ACJ75Z_03230 [Solirubrobacterales bacterium]
MPERRSQGRGIEGLTFQAFGVGASVVVEDSNHLELVRGLLPPGSEIRAPEGQETTFELNRDGASAYVLVRDASTVTQGVTLEIALDRLEHDLRALVAAEAPAHVFVHAGAVGHKGAAILMPGSTHAGKTSLVAALVRAGAEYYSDEYAPIDHSGRVHPFAKPLSIRDERFMQVDHEVETLGGVTGREPLPIGLIVMTTYESGAEWRPRRLSSGEAVLAVLAHTVPAQSRPTQALRTIRRSLERATVIEGTRGEADSFAPPLLTELERARSAQSQG